MKYKYLVALFLLTISIQGVLALNGNLYFVDENSEKKPISNDQIEILFSNGDKILTDTNGDGKYSFNPEQVFCWDECNFAPKVKSESLFIEEENILIKYSISNFIDDFEDYSEEVYVDENAPKVELEDDEENNIEPVPSEAYRISLNFSLNIEGLNQYSLNAYSITLVDDEGNELEFESESSENEDFLFELDENKQYFIEYYYLVDEDEPILKIINDADFEEVDKSDIYVISGKINKIELFEPAIRTFAAIPEPELPAFSLSSQCQFFNDNPSASSHDPILLVHGLHGDDNDYWGHIPSKFIDNNFKVYQVIYSPANNDNRYNAYLLKQCINGVKQHASVSKVNLVGHSMGGLVSRVYTTGLGRTSSGNQLSYGNDVNHLVTIGSPLYGSYASNKLVEGDSVLRALYKASLLSSIFSESNYIAETFDEPAYHDLSVGSALTWNLNEKGVNGNIKHLAITGIADDIITPGHDESDDSDSVVSASSASLRNFQVSLVLLQLNHANEHGKSAVPGVPWCSTTVFGIPVSTCNINNLVDGISSFLKDQSQSSVKNSFDLASDEYYVSSSGAVTDNPPLNEGMVLIRFSEDETPCSTCVKLRKNSIDYPLVKNIDTDVFTYYSGHNSQKGTTLPVGSYDLYVDNQDTGFDVGIAAIQTNIEEVTLSTPLSCSFGPCCDLSTGTIRPSGSEPDPSFSYADSNMCFGQDRIFRDYYCDGTTASIVPPIDTLIETCAEDEICSPNACLETLSDPIPKIEFLPSEEDFFFNHNSIEFSFNITNFNAGGKGQGHVHFHTDGVHELNFSDSLMFYNSPNNIVELNNQPGQTTYATWINSNTIRINNVSNGLHIIKAELVDSSHTPLLNPEAKMEIDFFVSSTENVYGLIPNSNSGIDDDAVLGDSNAPVTMIMFGGYEEPFSRKFYNETFQQIKSQYIDTGKINFVFRDFPLPTLYSFDVFAAEIAECIGEQGEDEAYFQMFNELFEKGLENADDLGYDIEDCAFSGQMSQEVVQDYIDADAMGVVGSPTFFINGEIISGAQPFANFQNIIEEKLNESIICFSDLDCGISGFIDLPFCSINNVTQNFQNFTCVSPGTIQSSCIIELTPTVIESCSDTCSEGQCVEIECSLDVECDDNNPETTDICHDAGTIQSSCESIEPEPTPELIVNYPQNTVYNDRRIPFEMEINEMVDEITYIDLADERSRERRLCSNCDSYGLDRIRTQSFVDGGHNISIKAMKDGVVVDEKIVSFMTDSRDPRISRTEPQRGFSNGVFNVEFTEENPTELTLFYGNSIRNKTVNIEDDCVEARRGFECETEADVSDFDGGNIEYWFELTDVAGSKDESRHQELSVDISSPIIENLEYELDGRNVHFTMKVIENNFEEVYYLDNSDERARERSICRRLNGDLCEGRASFIDGEHNITIYAVDEAGNMAKEDLLFFVDSRYPRISRTEPRRGFASGIFNVEFDEENPVSLFLNYGNSQTGFRNKEVEISSSCIIYRRYECETEVNLSDYHGQEIVYWFDISDILNQTDESRETSLDVDSVAPILNNPDSFWEQGEGRYLRYIYFSFNVTELNFDEINYIDFSDSRPRETRICSRLRDGVCEVRRSFRTGEHNLTINILDDVGNSVKEFIEFSV